MSTHHIRLLALAAVLLATPVFASPQNPTPAQLKAIDRYGDEFLTCRNSDTGTTKAENQRFAKACDRSHALMRKLLRQGFCTYKHYNVGRPDKNGDCVDMPDH